MAPARPSIQVIGVYKVPIEVTEWASEGKPHGPHSQDFEHLWLLEILIENADREFDQLDYTQANPRVSKAQWQVAYEETFLDPKGIRKQDPALGRPIRVAFFFHYLDLGKPIRTPFGDVPIPFPTSFPKRLRRVVRYIAPC